MAAPPRLFRMNPYQSFVSFYCKDGHPFAENLRRILVGVSRIPEIGKHLYFGAAERTATERYPTWSRRVTHDFEKRASGSRTLRRRTCDRRRRGGAMTRLLQSVQTIKDEGEVAGDCDAALEETTR
jgi:hypothetical protein